jgi:hypothetical protein
MEIESRDRGHFEVVRTYGFLDTGAAARGAAAGCRRPAASTAASCYYIICCVVAAAAAEAVESLFSHRRRLPAGRGGRARHVLDARAAGRAHVSPGPPLYIERAVELL